MSVKIMIERKFKEAPTIENLEAIDELRIMAMRQKGYIGGETIVNHDDSQEVLVLSAWTSVEDWRTWEENRERDELEDFLSPFLAEPAKIRAFMPSADYSKGLP